jgi:hypothetical protein
VDETPAVPSIPQPPIPATEEPVQVPLEPSSSVIASEPSELLPVEDPSVEQPSKITEEMLDNLSRHIHLAEITSRLLTTEVSLSRLHSEIPIPSKTDMTPAALDSNLPEASRTEVSPSSLANQATDQRSDENSTEFLQQRALSLGKLYFAKAFERGVSSGPQSTNGMRLYEFTKVQTPVLQDKYFLRNVSEMASKGKMLWEADYERAWKMALEKFAKGPGRYFLQATEEDTQDSRQVLGYSNRDETRGDELANEKDFQRERPPMRRETVSGSHGDDGDVASDRGDSRYGNRYEDALDDAERLAAKPVEIRLTVSESLLRQFHNQLNQPRNSAHVVGDFATDGDWTSQIFNPMWSRLGLRSHIKSIRNTNKNEFNVIFKSFDAAAAFVNRPDEHWLMDKISGQVYATWDWDRTNKTNLTAILTLPSATLEPWRRLALEHRAPLTRYGYPDVDWARSIRSVLFRLKISVGKDSECRRYKLLYESPHRVVLELSFNYFDSLSNFLQRKTEHYLTNPWKDRFFAKQQIYEGYAAF